MLWMASPLQIMKKVVVFSISNESLGPQEFWHKIVVNFVQMDVTKAVNLGLAFLFFQDKHGDISPALWGITLSKGDVDHR